MVILNESDFRKRLKTKPNGLFLFLGDEDYLKSYCVTVARQTVCPDEGLACFNDVVVDFPDYTSEALENALAAPPMMTDCKLVVLKSFRFDALKPSEVDSLCNILDAYKNDTANLLILWVVPNGMDVGYLPKRPSALLSRLAASVTPVNFEQASPQKLALWVIRHFADQNVKISDANARLVVDTCGRSMYALASEIDKLAAYVLSHNRDEVTPEDIRTVAIPEEEFDAFALTNAVMAGKRQEALDVLAVMKARQIKQELVFSEISRLYSDLYLTKLLLSNGRGAADVAAILKIHEYKAGLYQRAVDKIPTQRLKRALMLCRDADLAMKSFSRRNYEQIERLICVI